MKACVIGAGGAAGLCAIKNCIQQGIDVIGFEQTNEIGGTWVYTEKTGRDEYGLDIHSSMYRALHTNLPKEIMLFPDFPFPHQEKSFIPASDVLNYLKQYAENFNVYDKIKFRHAVVRVRPLIDDTWEVIVKNLIANKIEHFVFNQLLICNGHFSVPHIPKFEGIRAFKGRQMHSHEYRVPEMFTNERVLVVGAGSSGTDLTQEIGKFAECVVWSHHLKKPLNLKNERIIQKPDIEKFTANGVVFTDGSCEMISIVLYCTGYEFTFPFLSVDSNISSHDNYVQPLYKHCLSINRPSIAIIGLIFQNCPFQTFDLQLRFCLKFMTGGELLPSREEMLADMEKDMNERWAARGLSKRKAHMFGEGFQEKYYRDLAITADIEPIKSYVTKMYNETRRLKQNDITTFRNYKFTIIDDENFQVTQLLPR